MWHSIGPIISAAITLNQSVPLPAPTPVNCQSSPSYHQLDFWIGDWDTFETAEKVAVSEARARVEPIAQGCALHELYEQTDGLIGDSILNYDPVRKQWQQTWVTNRGAVMVLFGAFHEGALTLEGESHLQNGSTVRQRITWRQQRGGVREFSVASQDGGKSWQPAFDVLFLKHTMSR